MKQFKGFPTSLEYTALPNLFYSALLPQISDINELKVTLHLFKKLSRKRGSLRFVTRGELMSSISLRKSLGNVERPFEAALLQSLEMTIKRGAFLELPITRDRQDESLYFINTEANRKSVAEIISGELKLGGLETVIEPAAEIPEPSDIFTLYEENIGMLTPIIADRLKAAEKDYPLVWIKEAIEEAVLYNKRNWPYIARILENWSVEGKSRGTHRRDTAKKTGIAKYFTGKYGHMVQR